MSTPTGVRLIIRKAFPPSTVYRLPSTVYRLALSSRDHIRIPVGPGELHAERILLDGAQAGPELLGILDRLIGQVDAERQARRYDELLRKVESGSASVEERSEFQLLNRRPGIPPR